jgi:hypothetical protein
MAGRVMLDVYFLKRKLRLEQISNNKKINYLAAKLTRY